MRQSVKQRGGDLTVAVGDQTLMSLAACDERCAILRASDVTTAKPRPASPARAVSTAALLVDGSLDDELNLRAPISFFV